MPLPTAALAGLSPGEGVHGCRKHRRPANTCAFGIARLKRALDAPVAAHGSVTASSLCNSQQPGRPKMSIGIGNDRLSTCRFDQPKHMKARPPPPVFLIALNGWRFIGLGFVMAWVEGLLPGGFAWPAGLGDIAMAVTAPFVAARVAADDGFRFRGTFLAWNLFGIADFLDAVLWGTLYSWPGSGPTVTTALMQRLPFALIPCFFVPLVAMAHIVLLMQRRRS